MINGLPVPAAALGAGAAADPAAEIRKAGAASEFESLLIAQMLKAARGDGPGGGWLGTGDDQTGSHLMELAEEELAKVIASSGGLGLGRLVSQGLAAQGSSDEAARSGHSSTTQMSGRLR